MVHARMLPSLALLSLMQACGPAVLETGVYRAVVATPVGELPLQLEFIQQDDQRWHAAIISGEDRIAADQVVSAEGRLQARFAATTLEATVGRRSLDGRVLLSVDGQEHVLPFTARAGDVHRFYDEPSTDNADIAGFWIMQQSSGTANAMSLTVEIRQSHDQLDLRFASATDDVPHLTGQIRGEDFSFARFDGSTAIVYRGTANASQLAGDYWSLSAGRGRWTAERSDLSFIDP